MSLSSRQKIEQGILALALRKKFTGAVEFSNHGAMQMVIMHLDGKHSGLGDDKAPVNDLRLVFRNNLPHAAHINVFSDISSKTDVTIYTPNLNELAADFENTHIATQEPVVETLVPAA